jgi:hypothetical protein
VEDNSFGVMIKTRILFCRSMFNPNVFAFAFLGALGVLVVKRLVFDFWWKLLN